MSANWLRRIFGRNHIYGDLSDEIQAHLDEKTEELIASGMSREDAAAAARRAFGNVLRVEERSREVWEWPALDHLLADLCFALRMLGRSPGFTIVAVLTLALGIGANTAIFSVVNGILLEPLPYPHASRLVRITDTVSLPVFHDIQSQGTAFERMAIYGNNQAVNIRTNIMPDSVGITAVSADFFPMLGVRPLIGRPILPEDLQAGHENAAVLSYQLWQQDFGGDPNVLRHSLFMYGKPYKIIGVMPREFQFGLGGKGLWTPIVHDPKLDARRNWRGYMAAGRLKKGVSLDRANAQLATIAARLAAQYPATDKDDQLVAANPKSEMVSDVRAGLLTLLGAVAFVLLIACVNVSALLVARAWTRQKEVAIRAALGATRPRLIRQFLSESVVLALMGGALGALFSLWGISALRAIAPPGTPRIDRVRLDGNVLWFTLGISLVAAILFGLAPALQASARRMGGALKDGLGGSFAGIALRQRHYLRSALIVTEVTLAVVLVTGAALMIRSFEQLIHVNTGLRTDHVLAMYVSFSDGMCNEKIPAKCELTATQALDGIRGLPGVQYAAVSRGFALMGGGYASAELFVEGESGDQLLAHPEATWGILFDHTITPEYFDTMGIRLLQGRDFNSGDIKKSPPVVIIDQSLARTFLAGKALGKRIAVRTDKKGNPEWMQVVGVVSDDRDLDLKDSPQPFFYLPATQVRFDGFENFAVRTSGNPLAMAAAVEKQIWAVDRNAPVFGVASMDQRVAQSVAQPRFQTAILGCFGVIGLLLAAVGIYGVIAYSVVQRTHEIGVRMALGAQPRDVMRLIVGQGAKLALVGVACGLAAAWGLTRFLQSMLFEVKPADPATFVGVAVLLLAVATLACWIPARRAMRVDPMVALRNE